jgi:hypothetical protein
VKVHSKSPRLSLQENSRSLSFPRSVSVVGAIRDLLTASNVPVDENAKRTAILSELWEKLQKTERRHEVGGGQTQLLRPGLDVISMER